MLDRQTFLRPTAHRGLHDKARGIVENTLTSADAAIAAGYAIECDVQCSSDDVAMVFHDEALNRLCAVDGLIADHPAADLQTLSYRDGPDNIATLASFLDRIAGRTPVLIEIKSQWQPNNAAWLKHIAQLTAQYTGPIALFSFDPDQMRLIRTQKTDVPLGLVSGDYRKPGTEPWWPKELSAARADQLSNLADTKGIDPDFIAYHIRDLDHPAAQHARQALGLPLFTWTVRTEKERRMAKTLADAAIFEGYRP
jgi:glycerophosphoryl diester phosphodiesterase